MVAAAQRKQGLPGTLSDYDLGSSAIGVGKHSVVRRAVRRQPGAGPPSVTENVTELVPNDAAGGLVTEFPKIAAAVAASDALIAVKYADAAAYIDLIDIWRCVIMATARPGGCH